eukprot:c24772_g3_i3 orf=369-680(+)
MYGVCISQCSYHCARSVLGVRAGWADLQLIVEHVGRAWLIKTIMEDGHVGGSGSAFTKCLAPQKLLGEEKRMEERTLEGDLTVERVRRPNATNFPWKSTAREP